MQHQFTRVFDILPYQKNRFAQEAAINTYVDKKWKPTSITNLIKTIDNVSCWLINKGLEKGNKVAIMPNQGNLDWLIIDFACQQLGVIIVPLHPTYSLQDVNFIFKEAEVSFIVITDSSSNSNVSANSALDVFTIELGYKNSINPAYAYKATKEERKKLTNSKKSIGEDDIFTIMYTSGTSGKPKGVILTHKNMVSNILFTLAAFPLEASRRVMSYLPFSHILERSACYAYLSCGANIYFVRSKETFLADFQSAQPYFSTSVPRVLEKMYAHLQEQALAHNLLKRYIVQWAINTAQDYNKHKKKSILLTFKLFFARLLVLNKWKNQLGGKLECMVVGAAALRPEIARMFSAANIRIREGYGMTEASPLISLNRFSPGLNQFGTVGIPIPAMGLKIDKQDKNGEGEILIKGPNVTQGYFNRPDLTKEAFTKDGWFKTGDVGKLIGGQFLKITDRKKDIFKTSAGKYIAPQPLENQLKSSPFILQSLVIGFGHPYVIALIVPNFTMLEEWCQLENIHWTSPAYMVHNIKVREKLEQEIAIINQSLPNYEKVRKFVLCNEEWTIEKKMLTATLKPIRKVLLALFAKEVDKLYA